MHKPTVQAFIATFLALGMEMGERTLQRARDRIRELLDSNTMSPESSEILEMFFVGIAAEPEPDSFSWLVDLNQPASVH